MSELTDLREALVNLTETVKGGSGGSALGGVAAGAAVVATSAVIDSAINTKIAGTFYNVLNNLETNIRNVADNLYSIGLKLKVAAGDLNEGEIRRKFLGENRFGVSTGDKPESSWEGFKSGMKKFGTAIDRVALSLTGLATLGLTDTVEGAQLGRAFGMLAFQMADLLRGPIRALTAELYGAANAAKHFGDTNIGPSAGNVAGYGIGFLAATKFLGFALSRYLVPLVAYNYGANWYDRLRSEQARGQYDATHPDQDRWTTASGLKVASIFNPKTKQWESRPGSADGRDDHIKPSYQTSFGALTSLWENLQSRVTENPMIANQEKGLSIMERIYNAIIQIPGVSGEPIAPHNAFGNT